MLAFLTAVALAASAPPAVQPRPGDPFYERVMGEIQVDGRPGQRVIEIACINDFEGQGLSTEIVEAGRVRLAKGEKTKTATLNPQWFPEPDQAYDGLDSLLASLKAAGASADDLFVLERQMSEAFLREYRFTDAVTLLLDHYKHMTEPEDFAVTFRLGHAKGEYRLFARIYDRWESKNGEEVNRPVAEHNLLLAKTLSPLANPIEIKVHKKGEGQAELQDGFGKLPDDAPSGAFNPQSGEPLARPASVDRARKPGEDKPGSTLPFSGGIQQHWIPLDQTKVYGDYAQSVDNRFKNQSMAVVSGDGFTQLTFDGAALAGGNGEFGVQEGFGFPVGTVWIPTKPGHQAMLGLESFSYVARFSAGITAEEMQERKMFRAACLEFNKKPPEPGVAYRPVFLNDVGLTLLAQKLVPESQDVRLVQTAVWAYMDHAGPMEILERLAGGISAADYVRALRLIDESAGISEAMGKDEDVLHPVLMSVYGLPAEDLNWFMAYFARKAPAVIVKALDRPGANLQALYDSSASEAGAKDFVMNLGRLLVSGDDTVRKAVVEFLHRNYPSSRYELFRSPFMSHALAAAARSEDKALADRAASFMQKSGAKVGGSARLR